MKTNAPEKIYVYIPDDDIVGTASTQKGFPHQFVTEEYVRKDAFIEKACSWLENNLQGIVGEVFIWKILESIWRSNGMKWISTKIRFPKAGEQVLTACKNKNMEDGIWLYDLCYYYPDTGWENRVNWEDVLYWAYIDKPEK